MLKPGFRSRRRLWPLPAAFGRLCVETERHVIIDGFDGPAAFGRLCVETSGDGYEYLDADPAAFGRLCVETASARFISARISQPPSGGCVLKRQVFQSEG